MHSLHKEFRYTFKAVPIPFSEGLCFVLPRKVGENADILSTLLSLTGDIRLVIGKTPDLTVDWPAELRNSLPEEVFIVENAEKGIREFGKVVYHNDPKFSDR